jgi:hypothetical protein
LPGALGVGSNAGTPAQPGGGAAGSSGSGATGNASPDSSVAGPSGPSDYDLFKYAYKDIAIGTINYMSKNNIYTLEEMRSHLTPGPDGTGGGLTRQLLWNTFKVVGKGNPVLTTVADARDEVVTGTDAVKKSISLYKYGSDMMRMKRAQSTLQTFDFAAETSRLQQLHFASYYGALTKVNVATAAVGAGFAAYDTYQNIGKIKRAVSGTDKALAWGDLGQSTGNFLMSSSVVLAASGAGAPLAAGIFVVGAVLWTAGTVTKAWVNRKKIAASLKNSWNRVVKTASDIGNGFKKGLEKLGSLF